MAPAEAQCHFGKEAMLPQRGIWRVVTKKSIAFRSRRTFSVVTGCSATRSYETLSRNYIYLQPTKCPSGT